MDVLKELFRITRSLEQTAEKLCDIIYYMEQHSPAGSEIPRPPRPRERGKNAEQRLRSAAQKGVRKLAIDRGANGRAVVLIGDDGELELPPGLADLLEILAADTGVSSDDLVGYKTVNEIALLLNNGAKKPLREHAVRERISRLRQMLRDCGINPWLVETSRDGGYRFNFKRGADLVIDRSIAI
jgi:hypothetical protein